MRILFDKKFYLIIKFFLLITSCVFYKNKDCLLNINPKFRTLEYSFPISNINISVNNKVIKQEKQVLTTNYNNCSIKNLNFINNLSVLLRIILEKQIQNFGYKIVSINSDIDLLIELSKLYINVSKGRILYNVNSCIEMIIVIKGFNHIKITKHYYSFIKEKNIFYITNNKIINIINCTLTELINNIINDDDIYNFIKFNSCQYLTNNYKNKNYFRK